MNNRTIKYNQATQTLTITITNTNNINNMCNVWESEALESFLRMTQQSRLNPNAKEFFPSGLNPYAEEFVPMMTLPVTPTFSSMNIETTPRSIDDILMDFDLLNDEWLLNYPLTPPSSLASEYHQHSDAPPPPSPSKIGQVFTFEEGEDFVTVEDFICLS